MLTCMNYRAHASHNDVLYTHEFSSIENGMRIKQTVGKVVSDVF